MQPTKPMLDPTCSHPVCIKTWEAKGNGCFGKHIKKPKYRCLDDENQLWITVTSKPIRYEVRFVDDQNYFRQLKDREHWRYIGVARRYASAVDALTGHHGNQLWRGVPCMQNHAYYGITAHPHETPCAMLMLYAQPIRLKNLSILLQMKVLDEVSDGLPASLFHVLGRALSSNHNFSHVMEVKAEAERLMEGMDQESARHKAGRLLLDLADVTRKGSEHTLTSVRGYIGLLLSFFPGFKNFIDKNAQRYLFEKGEGNDPRREAVFELHRQSHAAKNQTASQATT